MNLSIDLGNTSAKVGLFASDRLIKTQGGLSLETLCTFIQSENPSQAILSSVRADTEPWLEAIRALVPTLWLQAETPVPLQNQYLTPETLGLDRVAAAVGAKVIYPKQACLVIDLGTCITYDFVDEKANFLGGSISPGLKLRFRAMHHFTGGLPSLEPQVGGLPPLTGKNTYEAMQSGVIHGIVAEIEGFIRAYRAKQIDFEVLICGGDTDFFESKIKERIFAVQNLTLTGLNRILQYNVGEGI